MQGTWFLAYDQYNPMEQEYVTNKVLLIAETEGEAIAEGKLRWQEISSKGIYTGRNNQTYPRNAVVIYQIRL